MEGKERAEYFKVFSSAHGAETAIGNLNDWLEKNRDVILLKWDTCADDSRTFYVTIHYMR